MSSPDPLTPDQLEELAALLRQRQEDLQSSLEAATDEARPVGLDLPIGRLTRMDALQQQQMASARRSRLQTQLSQLRQALGRMAEGTYGECVRCGELIGYARLVARPEAPFCVACQGRPGA